MQKLKQKLLALSIAILLPVHVMGGLVVASSAPVQFTIPDTTLTIKGFASPGAFVQIFDGNALIGTVLADSNGVFEKDFPAMTAGLHNMRITYDDVNGISSDPLAQTINIRAQSDTAVEYFLPPTLSIEPVSAVEGELVTFSGSTLPNTIVEISLDGGITILRPQADATGRYSISIDTTGYYFGEHSISATASQGGLTSFQTLKKPFIVLPVESGAGEEAAPGALTPPIIETLAPGGQLEVQDSPALIRGTAQPNSQIIIYVDGEPIGSTFVSADGTWFFNIDIQANKHDVRVVSCFGAECSDFSNLITIVYKGDIGKCSQHRFWLSEYRFWGLSEGGGIDLNITGISGTPPYELVIDWGDTTVERFNRNSAQSFNVNHTYKLRGNYNGSITIGDEIECEFTRYFSVEAVEEEVDLRFFGLGSTPIILAGAYLLRRRRITRRRKLRLAR